MANNYDAVVLGSGVNALGVVRSLTSAGLRVAVVSSGVAGIASRSRYVSKSLTMMGELFDPELIANALDIGNHKPVLFLTEELDVFLCLADVERWESRFSTYFYTPVIARELLSKEHFERHAAGTGSRIPRTIVVKGVGGLELLDGFRFPVIVKPTLRDSGYSDRFDKAYKVEHSQDVSELVGELRMSAVDLIIQEWIDGRDSDIYFNILFIGSSDETIVSFVGRKVLCWPPKVGGTASCVAAPEYHELLTSSSEAFLRSVEFRGFVGIEYKRDSRDGEFYMIEPTIYRTDYQHEIAVLSGCNLLDAIYRYCRGERFGTTQANYSKRSYWRDFPASRYSSQSSQVDRLAIAGTKTVDAYFRWLDPVPGVIHYGKFLREAIRGYWKKVSLSST